MVAERLELSYPWKVRLIAGTIAAVVCIVLLAATGTPGWATVAIFVFVLWLMLVGGVYLRTRAHLSVDGSKLTVRHFRGLNTIEGSDVRRVTEYFTRQGPSHKITVETDEGMRRYIVPTALFRYGHSTLFTWLMEYAPQADMDKGSAKTLEQLRTRGLVE
jgi:hypothetical protein